MKNLVIDIDIENEKIIMYDIVKKIIFENYGIIFGDIVISNIAVFDFTAILFIIVFLIRLYMWINNK